MYVLRLAAEAIGCETGPGAVEGFAHAGPQRVDENLRWMVRTHDGRSRGPLSRDAVQDQLIRGALIGDDRIARDGGEWAAMLCGAPTATAQEGAVETRGRQDGTLPLRHEEPCNVDQQKTSDPKRRAQRNGMGMKQSYEPADAWVENERGSESSPEIGAVNILGLPSSIP